MPRKMIGVRRHGAGFVAYVDVVGHPQQTKTYPLNADPDEIRRWREQTKKALKPHGPTAGTFAADIVAYLLQVADLPTKDQIERILWLWADALGRNRPRGSITHGEINAVMATWLTTPTNQPDPSIRGRRGRPSAARGVAPATVKKRRGILRAFFNVMNGKGGTNPVRDSKCPKVPDVPDARGIPLAAAMRVIAAMPDHRYLRKGIQLPATNKARALVMLWTGFPPHIIEQIQASDLHLTTAPPSVDVGRRLKGGGVEARNIHLSAQAVAAFQRFVDAGAFGVFAEGALNVSVKRAAKRSGVVLPPRFHAYDLRHSFGGALYKKTGDLAAVSRAMLHAKNSTIARRYTEAVHGDVDAAAAAQMSAEYPVDPVQPPVQILSTNPVSDRKRLKKQRLRQAI